MTIYTDSLDAGGFEILAGDAGPGGLLRVRQKATRADARNKNNRVYPRAVLQDGITKARARAKAGAMLSEYKHPDVARVGDEEVYVDNPDRKCARVDDISDVGQDGWVTVDRTILDTEEGQRLAARFRAGNPPGISTRFKMIGRKKKIGGLTCDVAESLEIHSWDDVENPAVDGAGDFKLLTDSELALVSATTSDQEIYHPMTLKALRQAFITAIEKKSAPAEVLKARADYHLEVEKSVKAKTATATDLAQLVIDEEAMKTEGYRADKPAPTFYLASKVGEGGIGYGEDIDRAQKPIPPASEIPKPEDTSIMKNEESKGASGDGAKAAKDAEILGKASKIIEDYETEKAKAKSDAELKAAIEKAALSDSVKGLTVDQREYVLGRVARIASTPESVEKLVADEVEAFSKIVVDSRLVAKGFTRGQTVSDGANPVRTSVKTSAEPWMEGVDKLQAAADDWCRATNNPDLDPDDPITIARRKRNREKIVKPMIHSLATSIHKASSVQDWVMTQDAMMTGGERAYSDAMSRAFAAGDNTTTAQMFNQPTVAMYFMQQSFQDTQALDFVQAFGPGFNDGNSGWESASNGIGSVLRVPVEFYSPPANYGSQSGTYDAGLATPEGQGIDEATLNVTWLPFAPTWKRIAASLTRDAIRAMGNGPANYPVGIRTLFHLAYDKSRRIDKFILDEKLQISDEYLAVAVTSEAYTTSGSNYLGACSAYKAAGSVTVNLNPAKTASTTPTTGTYGAGGTDKFVTYGSTVLGAIRLASGAVISGGAISTPANAYVQPPTVRPRTKIDLNSAGQITTTTQNPFTVSLPANQVLGYLDVNGNIQQFPGTTAAPTCALDNRYGVLVFNAAAGLSGSTTISTAVTVSYSYATNFDTFALINPVFATGEVPSMYFNRLFYQLDKTAALMGSGVPGAGRYVKPNLMIGTLNACVNFRNAQIFYNFQSPKDTELFPNPDYFLQRSGIMGAEINAPWYAGDDRFLVTRRGSTKYGVDTPFELRGPFPKYDSNGKIVASDIYYGEENSVICTPQVQDSFGNVLNPYGRMIITY